MSPLRGVILNDLNQTFKTCEEVYPDIKAQFTTSAAIELDLIATYLHGDKASTCKAHVKNAGCFEQLSEIHWYQQQRGRCPQAQHGDERYAVTALTPSTRPPVQ
ncbi:hypothetical protein BCU30_026120 [Vibrio lentus]|uniref:hypothetical protein n=1 Tax=Vibrio lentus TaxID=136468 RepID=UPI0039A6EF31